MEPRTDLVQGARLRTLLAQKPFERLFAGRFHDGRSVVVRTWHQPAWVSERAFARLSRWCHTAARIRHARVARVLNDGRIRGGVFVTREAIGGPSLCELLDAGEVVSPDRCTELLWQLACGLDALHASGVVHGDLCDKKVRLRGGLDGLNAVLVDAGLAAATTPEAVSRECRLQQRFRFDWWSPERMASFAPSERDDRWALAIVVFRALTGYRPFPRKTALGPQSAVRRLDIPSDLRVKGAVRRKISAWFERALAPVSSFACARDMADAFEACVVGEVSPPRDSQLRIIGTPRPQAAARRLRR